MQNTLLPPRRLQPDDGSYVPTRSRPRNHAAAVSILLACRPVQGRLCLGPSVQSVCAGWSAYTGRTGRTAAGSWSWSWSWELPGTDWGLGPGAWGLGLELGAEGCTLHAAVPTAACRLQRTSTASNQYLTARKSAACLGRSPLHGGPSDGWTGASEPCQTMLRIQQDLSWCRVSSCRLAEEPPPRGLAGRGADS